MYRPLDPYARDFALTTLVAMLRYDVRMAQLSEVVDLNISTFLRSDVVVDALVTSMGASLDATRRKALELYGVYVDELACFYLSGLKTRKGHMLNVKTPKLATREERESTVYVTSAENCLVAFENLIHKEVQGNLSERNKQRLTDRLLTEKARRKHDGPVAIEAPQIMRGTEEEAMEAAEEMPVPPPPRVVEPATANMRARLTERLGPPPAQGPARRPVPPTRPAVPTLPAAVAGDPEAEDDEGPVDEDMPRPPTR